MGSIHFVLPNTLPVGGLAAAERARFAGGYDRIPFPTDVNIRDKVLTLTRSQHESGSVAIPWPVADLGFPVTTTATLRERPTPYRLLVELARGKLNQVRNQTADWNHLGLPPDLPVVVALKNATRSFCLAVQADDPEKADTAALEALTAAYDASQALAEQFIRTSIELRRNRETPFTTQFACQVTVPPPHSETSNFLAAFNAVNLVPNWAQLEPSSSQYNWAQLDKLVDWAQAEKLPIRIGPLLDLGGPMQPEWLAEWHGELPSLAAFFCDFIETAVHRYRNRVKDWVICTGFNNADHLGLSEDDRIRLVVRILDAARTADPDGRWTVGVNQPWGEYLEHEECTYSPLVFADTLLRTGLPIAGFQVEIAAGGGRRNSLLRDGLDTVRLLDLLGILGTPIDLLLRHPGRVNSSVGGTTIVDEQLIQTGWRGSEMEYAQADWGAMIASIALGMPHIRSICWDRWSDGPEEGDTYDGIVATNGHQKLLQQKLQALRQTYL